MSEVLASTSETDPILGSIAVAYVEQILAERREYEGAPPDVRERGGPRENTIITVLKWRAAEELIAELGSQSDGPVGFLSWSRILRAGETPSTMRAALQAKQKTELIRACTRVAERAQERYVELFGFFGTVVETTAIRVSQDLKTLRDQRIPISDLIESVRSQIPFLDLRPLTPPENQKEPPPAA